MSLFEAARSDPAVGVAKGIQKRALPFEASRKASDLGHGHSPLGGSACAAVFVEVPAAEIERSTGAIEASRAEGGTRKLAVTAVKFT